jgi:hypothetical protein
MATAADAENAGYPPGAKTTARLRFASAWMLLPPNLPQVLCRPPVCGWMLDAGADQPDLRN